MHRLYHAGILFPLIDRSTKVDEIFTRMKFDWVRYTTNSWLIWTEWSSQQIYEALKYSLYQDEQILIIEVNANNRYGFLSDLIWQWIEEKRQSSQKTLAEILDRALSKVQAKE